MSALKSANGWTASADQLAIGVKSFQIKGTERKVRCAELVAPLLCGFASEFHHLVEVIDEDKTFDDWGYAFRDVRGGSVLSNHASGTAIDLNATQHPLGKSGTFTDEQVTIIQRLCKKYGLKWGGDYVQRKDEMHFEVTLTPAKAAALVKKLGANK
jgi:hypothetical protein